MLLTNVVDAIKTHVLCSITFQNIVLFMR